MNALWTKAREAAQDARTLLNDGRFDAAANRAYYAMFNAARTLLRLRGVDAKAVKKHATVLRMFSFEFVGKGEFDGDDGRALRLAADARAVADYGDQVVSREKAAETVASMDKFMQTAERLVRTLETGGENP